MKPFSYLSQESPILWNGDAWLILGYPEAVSAFQEPRLKSARLSVAGSLEKKLARWILFQDGHAHEQTKGALHRAINRISPESKRTVFSNEISELLEKGFQNRTVDVMEVIAKPLQALSTDLYLGTDFQNSPLFFENVKILMSFLVSSCPSLDLQKDAEAALSFLETELTNKLEFPVELVPQLSLLATASFFIYNFVGLAILLLHENPDAMKLLQNNPEYIPSAVQELMRLGSPSQFTSRIVSEPMEFFGKSFEAGQRVSIWIGAANRDPRAFVQPNTLDVTRSPNRHLAWGLGKHACTGAMFGSMTGELTLQHLIPYIKEVSSVEDSWLEVPGLRALDRLVLHT